MKQAFIFDLDGVIVDDEKIWEEKKQQLYHDFFGEEVSAKLGLTSGVSMDGIYDLAIKAGARLEKQELLDAFFGLAMEIYQMAPISQGLPELVAELRALRYSIGIVSSSPMTWITIATKRLPFENDIELIVSSYDRDDIRHKPAPDGYLEAMKAFRVIPQNMIALEDSNAGIASAKTSGAYTIGLRQNLIDGYVQKGADDYANSIADVIRLVRKRLASSN